MMLCTLTVIGSILVTDTAVAQQPAPSERYYVGGFQSLRGFEDRSVRSISDRFYSGGTGTLRGFEFVDSGSRGSEE